MDGGSSDRTIEIAKSLEARTIISKRKGRAFQMNFGCQKAEGSILYFLHSDSFPPEGFDLAIIKAVKEGYGAGCFRISFHPNHPFLRSLTWLVRFNIDLSYSG